MKRGCASVVTVLVLTLIGAVVGSAFKPSYPWTLVSPLGVDIVDMQAYHLSLGQGVVLLARTGDRRLLSTGIVYDESGYQWMDISGGHLWSDFPEMASAWQAQGGRGLFISYEGSLYQLDAGGQWQRVEAPDSLSAFRRADRADLSTERAGRLAGDVVKVQSALVHFEGGRFLYALVKGEGVYACRLPHSFSAEAMCMPLLPGAIIGFCAGCLWVGLRSRKS
jgi:hypothetical protein